VSEVDTEALAEPHRQQRALQAVLERHPIPRSVASDSAATTSAARIRSPPWDATSATNRPPYRLFDINYART
jgi:hypothetical protein